MPKQSDEPFEISVIVPVYNSQEFLDTLLEALDRQTLARDRFEVCVVDNGSKPPMTIPSGLSANIRIITESKPGSYAARNTGIANTSSPYLAFTDADCVPQSDWLANGLKALESSGGSVFFAGDVQLYTATDEPTPVEIYELVTEFDIKHYVEAFDFGPTANLFVPRDVLEDAGGFNADMKSSGDSEWCRRAQRAGFELKFLDSAVVQHPARRTIEQLTNKIRRLAGGAVYLGEKQHSTGRFALYIGRKLLAPNVVRMTRALHGQITRRGLPKTYLGPAFAVALYKHYVTHLEMIRVKSGGTSTR